MKSIILNAALAATLVLTGCQSSTPAETASTWEDAKLPEWAVSANIYEVNVRQYTPEGTLKAFQAHLPRLAEQGVDVLWFMPIQPIGEENRKGELGSYYSISDYTSVNPNFGSLKDFQNIVKQAHKLGMKVVLDWVANHTSFDHTWVSEHPDYYTHDADGNYPVVALDNDGVPTDWTDVADLNYDSKDMREEMIAEMSWWVENTDIDGFRCDVAGFVPYDFWRTAISTLRENHGPLFMLAEWEDPALIDAGFNAVYGWEFHHIMNEVAQGKKSVKAIEEYAAKCDTVWPEGTMKMYFTTNHDENSWNGTVSERMGQWGPAMLTLAYMMDRSFPLIYSGQEAGLDHRYPFFSKDTVGVNWDLHHKNADIISNLNQIKKDHPALWNGKYGGQTSVRVDEKNKLVKIKREVSGDVVMASFSFGDVEVTDIPPMEGLQLVSMVPGAAVFASAK